MYCFVSTNVSQFYVFITNIINQYDNNSLVTIKVNFYTKSKTLQYFIGIPTVRRLKIEEKKKEAN